MGFRREKRLQRKGSALDETDVSGSLRGRRELNHASCVEGRPYVDLVLLFRDAFRNDERL